MRARHLLFMILAGAAGVGGAAGCAGGVIEARAAYPAPGMIEIQPGVWVVDNAGYPTYFADDYYWYLDGGLWYRRPRWGGPWARVDVRVVPGRVVHREHRPYRAYVAHDHSRGTRSLYRDSPRRR